MSIGSKVAWVLFCVCWILGLIIFFQHLEIERYKADTEAMSEQVGMLETQADELAQRYKDAQQQSDQETEKSQKEVKEIMVANVPVECDDAIKWAINEAKVFNT